MTAECSRPKSEGSRRFPAIGEVVAGGPAGASGVDPAAARVLALGVRPADRRGRASGKGLDPAGRLGRVIWLHREGAREEKAGRWSAADFYWSEALAEFLALVKNPDVARQGVGLDDPTEADRLLRALVDEVFIDTHCGFFNGRVASPGVKATSDRAFDHIRAAERWIETGWTGIDDADRAGLLAPVWELRLDLAQKAKRWNDGAEALEQLRRLSPSRLDLRDRTVSFEIQRAFESLSNGKDRSAQLNDAGMLKSAIDRLNAFRTSDPGNLQAFEALGHLHHIRAIKLANAGRASEGLADAQRALDHWPNLEGAVKTRDEVEQLLKMTIVRAGELRAMVASRSNTVLNSEGQWICTDASVGYKLFNEYVNSGRPGQLAVELNNARNRDIWRRAGLAEPADRFDERANALVECLNEVIRLGPTDPVDAKAKWGKVAIRVPGLTGVDATKVGQFLVAFLFDRQETPPEPVPEPVSAASEAPSLPSAAVGSRLGEEPMEFWLFGPRRLGLKAFAAAALLLLLVGAVLAVTKTRRDQARDTAYEAAIAARAKRDHLGVIRGVEAFLGNSPLRGTDWREAMVRSLYDEAIVLWFVGRNGELDAETQHHVDTYKRLLAARRS